MFCKACVNRFVRSEFGDYQRTKIYCMERASCTGHFAKDEIQRCLQDDRYFDAMEQAEQDECVRQAVMDSSDLEDCPRCGFVCFVDKVTDNEKELHCQRGDCQFVSCRSCKKAAHPGQSCEGRSVLLLPCLPQYLEFCQKGRAGLEDRVIEAENQVAERMTEALIRRCGKCALPFIKEEACNKVVCTRCRRYYSISFHIILLEQLAGIAVRRCRSLAIATSKKDHVPSSTTAI